MLNTWEQLKMLYIYFFFFKKFEITKFFFEKKFNLCWFVKRKYYLLIIETFKSSSTIMLVNLDMQSWQFLFLFISRSLYLRLGMVRFGLVFAISRSNRCWFDFLSNRFRFDSIWSELLLIWNLQKEYISRRWDA